jgi:LemA protein
VNSKAPFFERLCPAMTRVSAFRPDHRINVRGSIAASTGRVRRRSRRKMVETHSQPGRRDMTKWILLALLAAAFIYVVAVFNRLVRMRNLVREGWSGIDVQLKRRTDLVPNLVQTVQAYAAHERGVLEDVTRMRASSMAASDIGGQAAAARGLQASLGKLLAVAEAYPELKADKNFLALQQELANVEDQLQMARRYYNGTVRNLNIAIQSFPSNIFASLFGFRTEPFFELDDRREAAAPGVAFAAPKS